MNLKFLTIATITFLIFSNIALAMPVGHVFYGTVTLNGNPAPDGTTVSARLDEAELASTTTSDGKYNHLTLSLDAAYSGRTIDFFVNGKQANENYQFCFDFACLTELDLSVTIETTQPPSPPGGGGGGGGGGFVPPTTEEPEDEEETTEQGCQERWTCSEWGECENGIQTRTCTDQNNCGTKNNEPFLSQPCTTVGVEEEVTPEDEEGILGGPAGFFLGISTTNWIIGGIIGIIAAAVIIFLVTRLRKK